MSATNPISINITQKSNNPQEIQKLNNLLQRAISELSIGETDPQASDFEFSLSIKV